MAGIFTKLNQTTQTTIVVLNAPPSFEADLAALVDVAVERSLDQLDSLTFALVFVTLQSEIDALVPVIASKAIGDALVWFAYPKGSSKRYRCDFNRDIGWAALGSLGFEGVRQVAIDDEWSALRFRQVEYIMSMQRDAMRAMSDVGKARVQKG